MYPQGLVWVHKKHERKKRTAGKYMLFKTHGEIPTPQY